MKEKNFDGRSTRRQFDREFSKKAELEMEMARQREEWVYLRFICDRQQIERRTLRRASRREGEVKETQRVKSLAAKISIPGTPRTVGIGAGARVVQTPRRQGGI